MLRARSRRQLSVVVTGPGAAQQCGGLVGGEVGRRAAGDQVSQQHVKPVEQPDPFAGQVVAPSYFDRKKAAGKTSMEAMRALKRRLSDVVYRQMLDDATAAVTARAPSCDG